MCVCVCVCGGGGGGGVRGFKCMFVSSCQVDALKCVGVLPDVNGGSSFFIF